MGSALRSFLKNAEHNLNTLLRVEFLNKHFWLDNSVLWGAVLCMAGCSNTPRVYPLDPSSTPLLLSVTTKNVSDVAKYSFGAKSCPAENH